MKTIEDIITGELIRIPRKLKKKIHTKTTYLSVRGYDSLSKYVFIYPWCEWVSVKEWK